MSAKASKANLHLTACPQNCGAAAAMTCQSFDCDLLQRREAWGSAEGSDGVQSVGPEAGMASKSWGPDHLQVTDQARSEASLSRGHILPVQIWKKSQGI